MFFEIAHLAMHDDVIKLKHFRVTGPLWGESTDGFLTQSPVTQSFDISFDLRQNKQLSEQSRRRWLETQSRSLWRHCNCENDVTALTFMFNSKSWWKEHSAGISPPVYKSRALWDYGMGFSHWNGTCHHGGPSLDYHHGALSLSQFTATRLKIGYP